ncbi:MAG: hypothetical protein MI810_14805 [Flavobacteriales bacterium]|nr:hypothetical protein [Flavobacteriales bacterium]
MKKYLGFCILISFIVIGCKKQQFTHSEEEIVPEECLCSEMNDSIPGVYTGRWLEMSYNDFNFPFPDVDTIVDTVITIEISRVWTNTFEDSLICLFDFPIFFDEPIKITDNSGYFIESKYSISRFYSPDGLFGGPFSLLLAKNYDLDKHTSYTTFNFQASR